MYVALYKNLLSALLNEMGGACSEYKKGEAYTGFWWGKPEGKRPIGRPRRR